MAGNRAENQQFFALISCEGHGFKRAHSGKAWIVKLEISQASIAWAASAPPASAPPASAPAAPFVIALPVVS